jgi:hypothetical protein
VHLPDHFDTALLILAVAGGHRIPPFLLCLVVLASTGKTKGFQDVAAVFARSARRK